MNLNHWTSLQTIADRILSTYRIGSGRCLVTTIVLSEHRKDMKRTTSVGKLEPGTMDTRICRL